MSEQEEWNFAGIIDGFVEATNWENTDPVDYR